MPRKQLHTARRIWQRLVNEHGADVSERQVCRYVHDKRHQLGDVGEVFVPLISDAGVEAEVDWGQATVVLRSEPVVVHLFEMRACFSGAALVMAFGDETQQAFLEGHVRALEWHGGVFDLIRFEYVPGHIFVKHRPRTAGSGLGPADAPACCFVPKRSRFSPATMGASRLRLAPKRTGFGCTRSRGAASAKGESTRAKLATTVTGG